MKELLADILSAIEEPPSSRLKIILNTNFQRKEFPSFEEIEEAIHSLCGNKESFLVLERYPLLQGCVYLQAALPSPDYDDGLGYLVELRHKEGEVYRQYRLRTHSVQEVTDIFADFYIAEQLPPLDSWQDVTQEFES